MQHAGRSVIVSGSTVAIGLVSMVILPLPFIRSVGLGGMLIPLVSVLASITLTPALLRHARAEDQPRPRDAEAASSKRRRRVRVLDALGRDGVDAAARDLPGRAWRRRAGPDPRLPDQSERRRDGKDNPRRPTPPRAGRRSRTPGITPGRLSCRSSCSSRERRDPAKLCCDRGRRSASARESRAWRRRRRWRRAGHAARSRRSRTDDASSRAEPQGDLEPAARRAAGRAAAPGTGGDVTLGGAAPEERDFVHAVYGKFGVGAAVRARAHLHPARRARSARSCCPLKAVILNLVSLGGAYGIVVFIFQKGHGSELIWNIPATDAVISWIPLMIFAFLFGISMDYEVFMITRMREAYDETGDTNARDLARARAYRQARDERRRRADVRVLRALDRARAGHQAVRDRARRGGDLRRDVIRALLVPVDDAAARPLELVAARVGGEGAAHRRRARSRRRAQHPRRRRTPEPGARAAMTASAGRRWNVTLQCAEVPGVTLIASR